VREFWLDKQFPAGTMIDTWKVVRSLGGGGFGAVLLVEKDGQRYALKLALRRESSRDDKRTHARTQRELTVLLMLAHPNIIKPLAYARWGDPRKGHLYFVMNYVEGWTLAEWVKRKHVTFREIIRVFRKLAAALAYLHAKRMFHRDLKLVNVVVKKDGDEPVLIDFGCAIHAHAEELTDYPAPPGTPSYQPPQVARFLRENRNKPGARYPFQVADELFSVGVMLYEVLTEPRPTEHSTRPLLNSLWRPPPPPHEVNPRVPAALSSLVMELLAREPERRPEGAETLERELAELEAHQGPEYDETAHLPSAQRTPLEEESNVLPMPASAPRDLAALWDSLAGRARGLVTRVLRWHKRLAVGGAVAALALTAVIAGWALWPSHVTSHAPQPAPSPVPGASALVPAPSAGPASPPLEQAVAPAPTAPTEVEKEGPPVTTPQPDTSKPAPTPRVQKQQRGAHSAAFLAWCKSFAIVGTVTAVASGCPGAQVRPEPFQCPEGAWELMEKWGWVGTSISLHYDDRHKPNKSSWVQSGPVVGVTIEPQEARKRLKKPVPVGTRFIGHLWVVPGPSAGPDPLPGHVVVRYDRVEFPNGENAPVCLLVGGDPLVPLMEVKDGSGKTPLGTEGDAQPVYRWKPERPE
jgi:serine/threonine-protein kinase